MRVWMPPPQASMGEDAAMAGELRVAAAASVAAVPSAKVALRLMMPNGGIPP
jgi:hypothetical protein